jgi:predicted Zn-dependent protease
MRSFTCILVVCLCGFLISSSGALVSSKTPAADASSFAERGISLAEKGRCREALPLLKKAGHLADKQLKYKALMSSARCAMSLDQTETAVEAMLVLNREFPRDPEVLYTTTHFYSELASRASQELAATAPTSAQAEELEAEAFESQGNWNKAAAQYKKILEQDPGAPGIHYRLGRFPRLRRNPTKPKRNLSKNSRRIPTTPLQNSCWEKCPAKPGNGTTLPGIFRARRSLMRDSWRHILRWGCR